MRSKLPIGFLLLLSMLFIAVGDRVLPPAIGQYSFQTRAAFDRMLISLFRSWRPRTNPNQRTERAVEKLENRNRREPDQK